MSIVRCSKCDREISDAFNSCIFCGNAKRNNGVYVEELKSLNSLRIHSASCKLIISQNNWKIEYCFREYQRHNFSTVTIGYYHSIEEYIRILRSSFIKYKEFNNKIPKNIKDYYENSECRLDHYDSSTAVFAMGMGITIRISDFFNGVCLDGYYEVRIETETELENVIKEWQYARERAMVIMPFLKIL